jgi:hypothetical protein
MSTQTTARWPQYLLLALILIIGIFRLASFSTSTRQYADYSGITDSLEAATIGDSIPFAMYKSKVDSLIALDVCNRFRLTNTGDGLFGPFAGYTTIAEPNRCWDDLLTGDEGTRKYYLALTGYRLNEWTRFNIRGDKYFLEKEIVDAGDKSSAQIKLVQHESPVRFVASRDNLNKGMVLIPVSQKQFKLVRVMTYCIIALLLIVAIIVTIILPLRILFSIAKGQAFTKRNTMLLNIIGWGFIGFAVVPNLLALLFSVIFGDGIPAGIYLPVRETVLYNSGLLIVGLIILLIASAFRRGYLVQEENESMI